MTAKVWIRDEVRRLVREVEVGREIMDPAAQHLAKRLSALPIAAQWTGWHLLTEKGQVIYWDETDKAPPCPETDEKERLAALIRGSERFPTLARLLPVRPVNARQCSACQGVGWLVPSDEGGVTPAPTPKTPSSLRCGECLSLGWLTNRGKSAETIAVDRRREIQINIATGVITAIVAALITVYRSNAV